MAESVATIKAVQQRFVAVCCVDASPCTNAPSVQRGWFGQGKQVNIPGPAKRPRTTRLGALHLQTQTCYGTQAPRGPSQRCLALLHPLHQRFPNVLLLLSLDNAKMHKSRAVKRLVQQHDGVALEHVEPYAPAYKPIERFWQWLKATVDGATAFETIAEVSHKVRQIIWHDNEHWLKSTLHCEFEP